MYKKNKIQYLHKVAWLCDKKNCYFGVCASVELDDNLLFSFYALLLALPYRSS